MNLTRIQKLRLIGAAKTSHSTAGSPDLFPANASTLTGVNTHRPCVIAVFFALAPNRRVWLRQIPGADQWIGSEATGAAARRKSYGREEGHNPENLHLFVAWKRPCSLVVAMLKRAARAAPVFAGGDSGSLAVRTRAAGAAISFGGDGFIPGAAATQT